MGKQRRKHSSNSILRLVFVGLSLLFQLGWMLLLILKLNEYSVWISLLTGILSVTVVLRLYSTQTTAAMKMPWIMLILTFPIMGLSMYLLFEILGDPGVGKRLRKIRAEMNRLIPENTDVVLSALEQESRTDANQFRYLWKQAGWPVYSNTKVDYFAEASEAFSTLKEELEKAEKFIFMEYFIVEDASSFQEIREILIRKAKQGVEVRLMYDDIGSVGYVNWGFANGLKEEGIRCQVFNPALPILNLFMNHRDHRKITVIDGRAGFTGGYNLADEYFDRVHPYGKWKDTGIRLEGEAVSSLTGQFLQLWSLQSRETEDYSQYLQTVHSVSAAGYVQPFTDDPLQDERAAESVYLNLISQAGETLYFMTPYLIITEELSRALHLAAKRGVDVRIITPGIPDKKMIYAVTRSYYAGLASQGVRIFEYTPGFCHAKQCICDGRLVSIGTSNLDYRSLYHHFENNVLFCGCDAVQDIAADFESTFAQCEEVTEKYRTGHRAFLRIWQCILRLFAPVM